MTPGRGERVDDLLVNGLKIIQRADLFRFGSDAVELANFVSGGPRDRAVDLGSGTGIITILLGGKKGIRCTGVEIQPELADMSRRSIEMDGLGDMCDIINAPMQRIREFLPAGQASIVVSNPPYLPAGAGFVQKSDPVAISRHEITVTFAEVADCAAYLLKNKGSFYFVHRADRLAQTIEVCSARRLRPKTLQLLTPAPGKAPHLFLMRCVLGGAHSLRVLPERVIDSVV